MKTLTAAVASLMLLSPAHAAGLGKLTVLSALGQPLRAEIALVGVEPGEADSLMPKLASPEAFQQANIEMNPALFSLRFAIEKRGTGGVIRVTSTQAMNEPYIDMLLELGGNKGRLTREYTFLLDPPEMRKTQPAQFGSAVSARTLPPPAIAAPRNPGPARATAAAPSASVASAPRKASAAPAARVAEDYTVRKGDTLAKIANRYRGGSISLDQMLVALYRANPDAFIDNNMNRVRAGTILKLPDADAAQAITQPDAHAVVVAQAADFNRYRNRLAEQAAVSTAKKSADGSQASAGKISTEIHEDANAAAPRDKLKLSKSGTTVTAGSDKVTGGVSPEDMIASQKALAEANARVAELEKNVGELQKLLEVKNQDLAAKQSQAQAPAAAATGPAAVDTAAGAAAKTEGDAAPASGPAAAAIPTDNAAAAKADTAATTDAAPTKKTPAVKPKRPLVVAPPPPPPSFFDELTDNAMFLPGAALLLALLAGLGIYSARRRKQAPAFDDSILNDSSLKTNSLFGSTGGQSVDTNNSVFNSNFVPSASQLDTNEVDPIAEADVYIAYGRDAQAEEILKEALRNQPERHAVRVKLLEIYANRNDARSFEILASELYGMTKGEGVEWQQAANLGLILDPSNPLYAAGADADEAELKTAALTGKTQRLDENLDDLLATTQTRGERSDAIETSPYFNSTTLLTEEALNAPTAPLQAPAASKSAVDDLAFDLEGVDDDESEAPAAAPATVAAPTIPSEFADINFDFMDDKTGVSAQQPEPDSLPTKDESASPASEATPDLSFPDLQLTDEAQSQPEAEAENPAAEALPDLDLSDAAIGNTVAGEPANVEPADVAAAEAFGSTDGLTEDENYSVNAEMATKLDLAMAYQEIGDKEGARELLEEVIKGGNQDQAEKARNSLARLA